MDEDAVWSAIDTQRLWVADLLEGLHEDQWRQPSLCVGWSVRDVAAHLTLQQIGFSEILRNTPTLIKARGLNRAIHDMACLRAGLPTSRLISELRAGIGSRKHNLGVTYRETLVDILVHSQDIAVPLGHPLSLPPEPSAAAAQRIWEMRRMFHARERFAPYCLAATDVSWTAGTGLDVRGPAGALLLLITGRSAALPLLDGEGVAALREQLRPVRHESR